MGNIVLLDELTINKIAAGEVIERPASVIKEMVENSIDAEATKITIEIKNGGISYIKITDNGKGIAQDDLEMAFERHATSKIRSAEDLSTVTSMGFRGEALASIAAIANVELVSKTLYQENGYKVVVEGGRVLEKEEIGCQTGTTITVQNLFFNTPVRYKFLKKDYTETGYIEDVITRMALVNPHISFKLINSGKTILQTSGEGGVTGVIYSIYGRDVAQGVIKVDYSYEDMKITGVIGKPEIARSTRRNQIFFVNKRHIKDKILTAATEQAYKGNIEAGKFGFVVLNIEMPQNKVDVNVHPAKLEVRFQEESKIFQAIFHAIKDTVEKSIAEDEKLKKADNIIIQSSNNYTSKTEDISSIDEKQKANGLFGWRKNKNDRDSFGENNIIEDLYNKKKVTEYPVIEEKKSETREPANSLNEDNYVPKAFGSLNSEANKKNNYDNVVDTSDVLKELKQINEKEKIDTKNEKLNEYSKTEENRTFKFDSEDKKLPDGSTYTYVGENKEKIEDLLRQLHPETYKSKVVEKVAEAEEKYELEKSEEPKSSLETINTYELVDKIIGEEQHEYKKIENEISEKIEDEEIKVFNNIETEVEEKYTELEDKENNITVFAPIQEENVQVEDIQGENTQEENAQIENEQEEETTGNYNEFEEGDTIKIHTRIQQVEQINIEDEGQAQEEVLNEQDKQEQQYAQEQQDEQYEQGKQYEQEQQNQMNESEQDRIIEGKQDQVNESEQAHISENKQDEMSEKQEKESETEELSNDFGKMYEKLFGTPIIKDDPEKEQEEKLNAADIIQNNVSIFDGIESYRRPTYKFIGIVFDSYIVAEIEKEMYIINQRTAKEKILYEKLKKNYYNQTEKDSQMLLLPDIIELSYKQMEVVKENYNMFTRAGFSLEEFGENTIKLIGVPTVCLELDTGRLFVEILDTINTVARISIQEKEEKFIATIAEKINRKSSLAVSIQEIDSLMYELLCLPNPFKYSFDKPIAIKMTKYDIERKFSRK